ncbi:TlpA family protein disulfide reductase [Devriesea agamarum]|uniref:TlpA family protein disulfide reductase n=1 Tax=Devriesea agamarum TaxID=472569 RepID=UPI000A03E904|nr:TlpA disulfide reductase family protein [Devriesea agamarum]
MNPTPARFPRRRLIATLGALTAIPVLAACSGGDASGRYDKGFVSGDGVTTEITPDKRGKPLDFSGTTYSGKPFSAASARGRVLVINVWYASCAPCRVEAPHLRDIAHAYQDRGVNFIGVNVRDHKGPAEAFEQRYQIPYPSMPDPDSSILYAMRGNVAPNAVPSTLVLDRAGRPAARISGAVEPSTLRAMIDRVLAE